MQHQVTLNQWQLEGTGRYLADGGWYFTNEHRPATTRGSLNLLATWNCDQLHPNPFFLPCA